MADETINIDILINTAKSAQSLKELNSSLNQLKNQAKSITKEDKDYQKLTAAIAETALASANAAGTFRDQRKALKELKDAMELLGPESKQFTVLNQAAGKLEFQMKKVNDAIKYTSGTPIHNLSAGFHGLRDAVLNLDFEEAGTALKAMGAQMKALASGALKGLQDRFKSFGGGIKNLGKGLGKAFTGDLKGGLDSAKTGFKGLGDALKGSGLFLLVAVIGAIVGSFSGLKNAGGWVGKIFTAIGDAIGWVIDKLKELSDFFGATSFKAEENAQKQLDAAKKLGEEEEKSFDRKKKIAEAEDELHKTKTKNKKEELELTKKQAKEEHDIEVAHLEFQRASAVEQIKALGKIREANGSLTDDQKKNLEDLKKSLEDLDADMEVADLKFANENTKVDKEISENKKEENKKRSEENKKNREHELEELKKQGQIDIQNTKENTQARVAAEEKSMDDILAYSTKNAKALGLNSKDLTLLAQEDAEKKKEIEQKYQDYLDEQSTKRNEKTIKDADEGLKKLEASEKLKVDATTQYTQARVNAEDASADAILAYKKANAVALGLTEQDITNLEADEIVKRKQLEDDLLKHEKELNKQKIKDFDEYTKKVSSMQESLFNTLSDLSDTFKGKSKAAAEEAFKIQKGLSLATATVKGVESVVNAIADNPFPLNIALAAAAAAASISNIAKISQTKFDASGGGTSSSATKPSVPSSSPPSFGAQSLLQQGSNTPVMFGGVPGQNNPGGNNNQNNGGNNSGGQVVKAYVTAGDIDTATNKSKVLDRRSKY